MQSNDKYCKVLFKEEPIDISHGIEFVTSPKCGAINTFSGTIRDSDFRSSKRDLEPILGIYYEAYKDMAIEQISTIIEDVVINNDSGISDPNCRVFVGVRLGFVPVGETSLAICISSTNRTFSHQATMMILEKIKSSVTIWKKVFFHHDNVGEWADTRKSEAYWLNHPDAESLGRQRT